tara:strand:+ start:652 stop:1290 length:639 start_codon:yes stop_codon:yes gene_type:complete
MPCLTHTLARAMFAKMAQIKPEDVPQDHALWDDAMWELLSLVAERIADDLYYNELQENTIRDPHEFDNITCKFAELITRLKLECPSFQKVPQEKRNKTLQYLDAISGDDRQSEPVFNLNDICDVISFLSYELQNSIWRFCRSTYYRYNLNWDYGVDDDDISDSDSDTEDTSIQVPDDEEEDYDSMPELIDAHDEIVREPTNSFVRRITSMRV